MDNSKTTGYGLSQVWFRTESTVLTYLRYLLLNLRSTPTAIPNVIPTCPALSSTRCSQPSLVSPSFNKISTLHSLSNITKKANDSTIPNFLPIHARGPIPNMLISCSGTLYHLEGWNLLGEGKMLGLRSGWGHNQDITLDLQFCFDWRMPIRSMIKRVPSFKTIVASCGRLTLTGMSSGKIRVRNAAAATRKVNYQRDYTPKKKREREKSRINTYVAI